uniref:Uncharacterized protein n=1 Tax=Panagrolaimus davidi TaxID=227884 RepID=A0A914QRQ4_9BILA
MKECLKEDIMKLDLEDDFQEAMRKMKILEAVKAKFVQESVNDENMVKKFEPELENESIVDSGKTNVVSGRFSMKATVIGASQKPQVYPKLAAKSKNAEDKAESNKEFGEGEQKDKKEKFAHLNGEIGGTFLDLRERKLFSYALVRVLIKEMMDVRERKLFDRPGTEIFGRTMNLHEREKCQIYFGQQLNPPSETTVPRFAPVEKTIAEKDFLTCNPNSKSSCESLKYCYAQENDEFETSNALSYILKQLQESLNENANDPKKILISPKGGRDVPVML